MTSSQSPRNLLSKLKHKAFPIIAVLATLASCTAIVFSHNSHFESWIGLTVLVPVAIIAMTFGRWAYLLVGFLAMVTFVSHVCVQGCQGIDVHVHGVIGDLAVSAVIVEILRSRRFALERLNMIKMAVDQTLDGIAIVNLDGNVVAVNRSFAKMHGYSVEELLGKHISIFHNEDQMPSVNEANDILLKTGEFKGEIWHARKDGSVFPSVMHNSLLTDSKGNPMGIIGTIRDATEAKRAEEELISSERLYHTLVEAAEDYIFIVDKNLMVRYINSYGARVLGRSKSEIVGSSVDHALPGKDVDRFMSAIKEAIARAESVTVEESTVFKHGRVWLHTNFVPLLGDSGEVEAVLGISRDVTARRGAEEELKRNERFLSSVFSSIQDGISILDSSFTILRVNHTMEKWYAHAMPLVGKKCYEAYHGRHSVCDICPTRETLNTGQSTREIVPLIGAAGEVRGWLELYSFPHMDESSGKMVGVIEYVRDISREKVAEQSLLESEERFRKLVEQSPDAIAVHDGEKVLFANSTAVKLVGAKSREDLVGKPIIGLVHEDSHPMMKERLKKMILEGKELPAVEEKFVRFDGKVIEADVSAVPLTYMGKPAVQVVIRDATERRRAERAIRDSEKRFRTLFENSPVSLWEEDFSEVKLFIEKLRVEGVRDFNEHFKNHPEDILRCARLVKIVDVNRATLEMYEVSSKEELAAGLENVFDENSYETFAAGLIAFAEGKSSYSGEAVNKTFGGKKKIINIRWVMPPGDEETFRRILVSIVDITEMKRLESEVREALKFKSDFMAAMSHELKTPLNSIIGCTDLVLKDQNINLPEKRIANLINVLRSADRLHHLINNILEMARIEAGRILVVPRIFSLKDLVETCVEMCMPLVEKKPLKILTDVDRSLPKLNTDQDKLSHILINLISNAIKFTEQGEVRVAARIVSDGGDFAEISVIDTGLGIPQEKLGYIFDEFNKIDAMHAGRQEGIGLGLSIVRAYLRLIGGKIDVESKVGSGSKFTVTIPVSYSERS